MTITEPVARNEHLRTKAQLSEIIDCLARVHSELDGATMAAGLEINDRLIVIDMMRTIRYMNRKYRNEHDAFA